MTSGDRQRFSKEGASREALDTLRSLADLPDEYLELLASSNGGEGNLDVFPFSFVLDTAEQAVQKFSQYQERLSGFFVFGQGNGGDLLAFDQRGAKPWPVVALSPSEGDLAGNARKIADDFSLFLTHIGVATPGS